MLSSPPTVGAIVCTSPSASGSVPSCGPSAEAARTSPLSPNTTLSPWPADDHVAERAADDHVGAGAGRGWCRRRRSPGSSETTRSTSSRRDVVAGRRDRVAVLGGDEVDQREVARDDVAAVAGLDVIVAGAGDHEVVARAADDDSRRRRSPGSDETISPRVSGSVPPKRGPVGGRCEDDADVAQHGVRAIGGEHDVAVGAGDDDVRAAAARDVIGTADGRVERRQPVEVGQQVVARARAVVGAVGAHEVRVAVVADDHVAEVRPVRGLALDREDAVAAGPAEDVVDAGAGGDLVVAADLRRGRAQQAERDRRRRSAARRRTRRRCPCCRRRRRSCRRRRG